MELITMKVLVIVAHPNQASFNHAIAATCAEVLARNGHEVVVHDLYAEHFNPLLPHDEFAREAALPADVRRHCKEVAQADAIVIVHPNWWGQPPAVLKGWVDRVIRPGVAYEFLEGDKGEGVPRGLLKAKCALIFNTSNTEKAREQTVFGDPLEAIWKSCIFGLCGVPTVHRRMFNVVVASSAAERKDWLAEVAATVNRFVPKRSRNQALRPAARAGG
jgi:NAD(P)H dehydrogenase (quinone)